MSENEDKINISVFWPFGPPIAKTKIPEKIITKLNSYFETNSSDNQKLKQLDHGKYLAGNVSKEIRIDHDYIKECGWLDFLANITKAYIKVATQKEITKFSLISSWVVSQFKHEYNPTHFHSGHISGAGFLKVPETLGTAYQNKEEYNFNGFLQLIHGSHQFISNSIFNIKPQVGDFYLFPHYLMHTVFPFKDTNEERRSISFNANIDENIYNVYEKK